MVKVVVTYDIIGNSNKIRKYLKSIGIQVQKSVFELEILEQDIDNVSTKLSTFMEDSNDSILIYNLGKAKNAKIIRLSKDYKSIYLFQRYLII